LPTGGTKTSNFHESGQEWEPPPQKKNS